MKARNAASARMCFNLRRSQSGFFIRAALAFIAASQEPGVNCMLQSDLAGMFLFCATFDRAAAALRSATLLVFEGESQGLGFCAGASEHLWTDLIQQNRKRAGFVTQG